MNGLKDFSLAPHVALADTRHGPLFVLKSDNTIGRSLLAYGEWTEDEIRVLRRLLRHQDCIVDIGANIGSHTVAFAKAVAPGGCVMAFEPHPRVFHLLSANTTINGLNNVRLYPAACAAEPGSLWFPELDYNVETNFGAFGVGDVRGIQQSIDQGSRQRVGQQVPIVTLDDVYDLPALRLLKIDVEGGEIDVLKGAEKTIRRLRPALYVENENPDRSERLLRAIADLGYAAYWHVVPLFDPDNFRRNPTNLFSGIACVNNLCLPEEAGLAMQGFEKVMDMNMHPRRK
jgi:FkbM family methyltransferase